jgi:signal transduction histidine kinase
MRERFDRPLAVGAGAQNATIADARQERDHVGRVSRSERTTPDGLIEALTALRRRCLALKARNCELAAEVKQLRAERRQLRSRLAAASNLQPVQAPRPARAPHDGVQNELVGLIVKLRLAEEERDTPPALAGTLAALGARAEAALDSVREIARGVYPPLLAAFGVVQALPAQAALASLDVTIGTAPRSSEQAEAAAYFSCLEAIQNAANTPAATHT